MNFQQKVRYRNIVSEANWRYYFKNKKVLSVLRFMDRIWNPIIVVISQVIDGLLMR